MGKSFSSSIASFFSVFLYFSNFANAAVPVYVAEAPSNNLELTLSAIQGARSSILVNAYEFTSPEIAAALSERIRAGVVVRILQEGELADGPIKGAAITIQNSVLSAMAGANPQNFYYLMSSKAGQRRYRFDHAKYMVIDQAAALVASENFAPTGNPPPGTLGNRGWEVYMLDRGVAAFFTKIFGIDANLQAGDLLNLTPGKELALQWMSMFAPQGLQVHALSATESVPSMNADQIYGITSPDTSQAGLVGLVDSAQKSLYLEQMTFAQNWGTTGQSPLLAAVLRAAQRGVQVRVLLNDETAFGGGAASKVNVPMVTLLNQFAAQNRLNLGARIANVKAMGVDYIHNKGALVDGARTLVSSINWNQNSVANNRETAVVLDSQAINAHYYSLFANDWNVSPPPPALH